MIEKFGKLYKVMNKDGKKALSKPMSKKAASKRLQQIEYFKHKGKK